MSAYLAVGIWHHWLVRRDIAFVHRFWPVGPPRPRLGRSMQLPFGGIAWSQEWVDGRPGRRQRGRAAGRLVEHLPVAARRRRARRPASTSRSRSGSSRRPARARDARAPRPVPRQGDVLDGLVLPGPRRRGPRRGRAGADRRALGRLRRAGARHPLRRHQPVGDRRGDLRAGAGARRARRPRRALQLLARHAAPARRGREVLDRLVSTRRRRELAGRADDLHRRRGDPRRRRAGGAHGHAGGRHHARHLAGPHFAELGAGVRLPVRRPGQPASPAYAAAPASTPAPPPR